MPAGYESTYDEGVQRMLFAVDGSATSLAAVGVGAKLAAADTQIRVVYVVDRAICPGGLMPTTPLELTLVKEGTAAIAAAAKVPEPLHNITPLRVSIGLITTESGTDDIASAILREAERCGADLIVMGHTAGAAAREPILAAFPIG
nr:universal stress protein [Caballeronia sp. NK8]